MLAPADLTREQLETLASAVQDALWRDGPNTEWTPETIDGIAEVAAMLDLRPDED